MIYFSFYFFHLGLICTFRTIVRSTLGDRTRLFPERYEGCVLPWCLYLRTIICKDERGTFRMNQTCGGLPCHPFLEFLKLFKGTVKLVYVHF